MNAVTKSAGEMFKHGLQAMRPNLMASLPSHIPVERFERAALIAVQRNPDLLKADRTSLFLACQRAAGDGLLPDGREGAIVTFGTQAQWMPMVAGLMKLARNSGEIASIQAHVAYAGEKFRVVLGDDEYIEHERSLDLADDAKPIAVYAVAKLKNGETVREVLTTKQVEKVRNVSRAKGNGPWVGWWDEMAKKTAIRRLTKRLPLSTDKDGDERFQKAAEAVDEIEAIDGTAQEVMGRETTEQPMSKLDAIEGQLVEQEANTVIDEDWDRALTLVTAMETAETRKALTAIRTNHKAWLDDMQASRKDVTALLVKSYADAEARIGTA